MKVRNVRVNGSIAEVKVPRWRVSRLKAFGNTYGVTFTRCHVHSEKALLLTLRWGKHTVYAGYF